MYNLFYHILTYKIIYIYISKIYENYTKIPNIHIILLYYIIPVKFINFNYVNLCVINMITDFILEIITTRFLGHKKDIKN